MLKHRDGSVYKTGATNSGGPVLHFSRTDEFSLKSTRDRGELRKPPAMNLSGVGLLRYI